MRCLYILEINPFSVSSVANISSYSEGCLFVLGVVSFTVQKLLRLIRSHLLIFIFIRRCIKKDLSVLPMFSSKSFIVYGLMLLLSHLSRVRLCATPSLGFSRQENWSGLAFPSPMHKSEK